MQVSDFFSRLAGLLLPPEPRKDRVPHVHEDVFEDATTSAPVEHAASNVQDGHGTLANLAGSHEKNTQRKQ